MGIDTKRIRVCTFVFMGLGAALAGVFSTMINFTWWPTSGESLPAAEPCRGLRRRHADLGRHRHDHRRRHRRVHRVVHPDGHRVGVGSIGFYVQFFNGLIIILALIGHRWNQIRYR